MIPLCHPNKTCQLSHYLLFVVLDFFLDLSHYLLFKDVLDTKFFVKDSNLLSRMGYKLGPTQINGVKSQISRDHRFECQNRELDCVIRNVLFILINF